MAPSRIVPSCLMLLACLVAQPARASTALDLDVEGLTTRAEHVVRARVLASEGRWAAGGRRIVTESRLRVLEVIAGEPHAQVLRVIQPGGAVGGLVQEVIGAARFSPGEEVVVFLRPGRPGGAARVVGMALGKYRVTRPEGAPATVRRDGLGEVRVLHPLTHHPQGPEQPLSLEALRQRVRAARSPR